jgi:hypothetical protein
MNGLAQAAGHTDREEPIKAYCKGLLLPGERKSVEPMAARLAPVEAAGMSELVRAEGESRGAGAVGGSVCCRAGRRTASTTGVTIMVS